MVGGKAVKLEAELHHIELARAEQAVAEGEAAGGHPRRDGPVETQREKRAQAVAILHQIQGAAWRGRIAAPFTISFGRAAFMPLIVTG